MPKRRFDIWDLVIHWSFWFGHWSFSKKKGTRIAKSEFPQTLLLCRCLKAAAYTAGFSPTEAAYSSAHVQSELVTDHLHFTAPITHTGEIRGGLAKPSPLNERAAWLFRPQSPSR